MIAAIGWLWLSLCAHAMDGNDRLELQLIDGQRAEGYFYRFANGAVMVSADGRIYAVPLADLGAVRRGGQPMPLDLLRAELDDAAARAAARDRGPAPSPTAVALASAAWAGAGPAMLGDRSQLWAYSAAEVVLLGGATYGVVGARSPGVTIPLVGVDLLLHVVAARDSRRRAQAIRRRRGAAGAANAANSLPIIPISAARPPSEPSPARAPGSPDRVEVPPGG